MNLDDDQRAAGYCWPSKQLSTVTQQQYTTSLSITQSHWPKAHDCQLARKLDYHGCVSETSWTSCPSLRQYHTSLAEERICCCVCWQVCYLSANTIHPIATTDAERRKLCKEGVWLLKETMDAPMANEIRCAVTDEYSRCNRQCHIEAHMMLLDNVKLTMRNHADIAKVMTSIKASRWKVIKQVTTTAAVATDSSSSSTTTCCCHLTLKLVRIG